MAEIDKSLPNTPTEIDLEKEETVDATEAVTDTSMDGKTEIEMEEDGSATINFDPNEKDPIGGEDHNANLAEFIDDQDLDSLGSELMDKYKDYRQSRQDWEESYKEGLSLLGFKYITRTEPFRGASSVTHPVLAEAVTQFQAQA